MTTLPSTTLWFLLLLAIAAGIGLLRHCLDRRIARQRRARIRRAAHLGLRDYSGRDWTLPRHETHETLRTKSRGRTTHGHVLPQALWCIGALLLAHVFVIAVHVIVMAVMGMQEPKW